MNKSAFRLILISAMLIQSIGLYAAAPGELNYQGKLADSTGNPLTGSYDFQFQICPSLSGPGCLPAAPLTFTNVAVANGVFNVIVTGVTTDMFPGTGGFLEVSVRQSGGGAYTPLAPREALAASPYAMAVAAGAITDTEVSSVANILPSKIAGGAVPVTGAGVFQSSSYNFPDKVRIGDNTAPAKTLEVNGDINIIGGTLPLPGGHRLLLDGGQAIFSNWTITTGSNIYRNSTVGIGKVFSTEPGAGTPAAALEVSGNINIVDGGALLLSGSAPVYSNWTQIGTAPNVNIYRGSYVGINMSANPTYPLIVTGADMTHTVGLSEGGNTGPLMVGYTNAAPGPAGYYAVYAP
jgi:hypothetical protein